MLIEKKLTNNKKHLRSQAGATLIELLISLFVMGVGMMGVLAIQTQSIRFNHQAYTYSQAVFLAQDILESMRANRDNAASYQIGKEESPKSTKDCTTTVCTPLEIKDWDLANWLNDINDRLPGGRASIDMIGSIYSINIEFNIVRLENELVNNHSETQEYTLSTGL